MFLWCHVRHINPVKMHPERIAQNDKILLMSLIMMGLDFLCEKKLKQKNSICINVFCNENKLVFPIYNSNQKIENLMDLLLVTDKNKSQYACIKDFERLMFHKTKNKSKKYFCKSCLQCFSSRKVLTKHKEDCLSINDAQSVVSQKGTIVFKNCFKQILIRFKVYADFECNFQNHKSHSL